MNKKPLFLLVVFIWALLIIASYLIQQYHQLSYHQQIMKAYEEANLAFDTMEFTSEALIKWVESDKEFLLEDQLYDVISIERKHCKVKIICLQDIPESQVTQSGKRRTSKKKNKLSKHKRILVNSVVLKSFPAISNDQVPCHYLIKPLPIFTEVPSPPPDYKLS